jgi:hypothetical protein
MTIAIPPDVWVQALLAFVAGVLATALGVYAIHRSWGHHDARSERDFILALTIHLVGISWCVLAVAIVLGAITTGTAAEDGVQEVVVFTQASVRIAVLILASHVIWGAFAHLRHHREAE